MKRCTKCQLSRPIDDFHAHPRTKDRRQQRCKPCQRKARAEWGKTAHGKETRRRNAGVPKNTAAAAKRTRDSRDTLLGRARHLLHNARSSARRSGVRCTLSLDFLVRRLAPMVCELSGLPFVWTPGDFRVNPRTPSIDRLTCDGDYSEDNVRLICWQANLARNEYGDASLLELAEGILRTISSRAPQGEGSTTISKESRAKRPEAPSTLMH